MNFQMEIHPEILQGDKIKDVSDAEIKSSVRRSVMKAVYLRGFDVHKDDIEAMSTQFLIDLRKEKQFSFITLKEFEYAIEFGIKGGYGDYMGINYVTLYNFIIKYIKSEERFKANKQLNPERLLPEKTPLSQTEKDKILKYGVIEKFNNYKSTGKFYDFGNPSYDFLANLGIINYTTEKKLEFMEEAKKRISAEQEERKATTDRLQRMDAIKIIEEITNNPNHNRVVSEAKLIALKEFFDNLILIDEEIENLL